MRKDYLDETKIKDTIARLAVRIEERFPGSGLGRVARRLDEATAQTAEVVARIDRPDWLLRAGVASFVLLVLVVLAYTVSRMEIAMTRLTLSDLVQISEAALNDVALIGAALIFLVSIETRAKRRRVIAAINTLRSIAHVIDMHQLTKDPHAVKEVGIPTAHSPTRELSAFELGRYLDYCSEMLSLTAKVGYLYAQRFPDTVAVDAVNELETLCTGLASKIWQKIMILPLDQRPRTAQ
ncbi:MAG: hypothetical protein ACOY3Y_13815 [Acidobacteriota bacterium]